MTKQQIDEVIDMICNIKMSGQINEDISQIVLEEAGAFYAGKKSAEEVADIIQSRAQVFICLIQYERQKI